MEMYVAIVGSFALGYFIGFGKGKSRGQVEGINFASKNDRERRMTEEIKKFFRRDYDEQRRYKKTQI